MGVHAGASMAAVGRLGFSRLEDLAVLIAAADVLGTAAGGLV